MNPSMTLQTPYKTIDPLFVRKAVVAQLERAGVSPPDYGNLMRGQTLHDLGAECALRAGISFKSNGMMDVKGLYTSTDFPNITNGVVGGVVMAGWEAGPQSWLKFAATGTVESLLPEKFLVAGGVDTLPLHVEGSKLSGIKFPTYAIAKKANIYGGSFVVGEDALINYGLDRVIDDAKIAGFSAQSTIAKRVFGVLAANPQLLDGGALFNSDAQTIPGGHANDASAGTALSATSLTAAKAAMRRQIAPDGDHPLNIRARFLIVSAELEDLAWSIAGIPGGFGEPGSDLEQYLVESGRVEIISTPYLTGNAWFLAANPFIAPLVNVSFLNGLMTPKVETKYHFESGGIEIGISLFADAMPADPRGGYRNVGEA